MRKILLILALFISFSGTAQNSKYYPVIMMMGQSSCDADALAFILASGITDATQKSAICTLVSDLKSASLWTKMQAIYPMVGGTATTTKYNLKDTSTFKITWSGGITYSSTGVTGNGTTGFGDTNYQPAVSGSQNSQHVSFYSRTDVDQTSVDIGSTIVAGAYIEMNLLQGGLSYFFINNLVANYVAVAQSSSTGYYVANRNSSTVLDGWRNGSKLGTNTTASYGLPNTNITLLAQNGTAFFSTRECAFATIGTGLSDTDNSNLYTIIQAFQTTLGRNI